jgi:hypothetical protein
VAWCGVNVGVVWHGHGVGICTMCVWDECVCVCVCVCVLTALRRKMNATPRVFHEKRTDRK